MRLKTTLVGGSCAVCLITVTFIVQSYRTQLVVGTRSRAEDYRQHYINYYGIQADKKHESKAADSHVETFMGRELNPSQFVRNGSPNKASFKSKNSIMLQPNEHNVKVNGRNSAKDNNSSSALYYCNFPSKDDYDYSQEGVPVNEGWILKQVQIVIRHGDRSPMGYQLYKKMDVHPDYCNIKPGREPSHPSLQDFVNTMSRDVTELGKLGRGLPTDPFPNHYQCGSAMLSQLGVVQHIHNGEILRNAYIEKNHLLREALTERALLEEKVYAVTTPRSRTIQSAVAFLYGLIPNFHLYEIEMKYSRSDVFSSGGCPTTRGMVQSIKNIQYKSYLDHRNKPAFKKLAKAFDSGDHSGALIDHFVTGFLCKGFELPCYNGTCADITDLDVLLDAEGNTMQRISEEASFINQSMLNLQPLLSKLSHFMSSRSSGENAPHVVLMSGHDTTLKPLIRALGIPEYRWPRLGTRLVFELWYDPASSKDYVRILLNGIDYTMKTKPCEEAVRKSEKACQAQMFHSYVNEGISKHFGAKTRSEACAM